MTLPHLAQFGLAGEWELEVWREIEDYAALDKVDAWYAEDPDGAKRRDDLWSESAAYFEWGPVPAHGGLSGIGGVSEETCVGGTGSCSRR